MRSRSRRTAGPPDLRKRNPEKSAALSFFQGPVSTGTVPVLYRYCPVPVKRHRGEPGHIHKSQLRTGHTREPDPTHNEFALTAKSFFL